VAKTTRADEKAVLTRLSHKGSLNRLFPDAHPDARGRVLIDCDNQVDVGCGAGHGLCPLRPKLAPPGNVELPRNALPGTNWTLGPAAAAHRHSRPAYRTKPLLARSTLNGIREVLRQRRGPCMDRAERRQESERLRAYSCASGIISTS
jgi:hypothetical protein